MLNPDDVLAAAGMPTAAKVARAAGYEAAVWRVLSGAEWVAVRVLRPGHSAANEIAMMRLARENGHPAPVVISHGRLEDQDWVVSTWCPGRTLGEQLLTGGDPQMLGELLGCAHAALHEPLAGGPETLCHLDFQPFNVLSDGGAVTGIVDWSNARIGDPANDLAWTQVVLELAPALLPAAPESGIRAFAEAWQRGYASVRPLPPAERLRAALRWASVTQLVPWEQRFDAGECAETVVRAARGIVRHWA